MIPNIFISSTIADLHYLRDGLRDAILDLHYRPVLSEYGDVGYLRPVTAAESCYRTVEQCQIVVLIVGKRYGSTDTDGISVTHREYRVAKKNGIPTMTFVEPQVLHYKEVFEASKKAELWNTFDRMDNPHSTFQLLDEIASSESYNAIIPFSSAADAKEKLKLHIADFVGEQLSGTIAPFSAQIKDVLAEIRTLRANLVQDNSDADVRKYLAATRYLLNDNALHYREFLGRIFGGLDVAVEKIIDLRTIPAVVVASGRTLTVAHEDETLQVNRADTEMVYSTTDGFFKIRTDGEVIASQTLLDQFHLLQVALWVRAQNAGKGRSAPKLAEGMSKSAG